VREARLAAADRPGPAALLANCTMAVDSTCCREPASAAVQSKVGRERRKGPAMVGAAAQAGEDRGARVCGVVGW
jgi:hypothetical protein